MQEKLAGYFALLLYAAGTVGLVWLCVRFILPWAAPFITAYLLAALLEKPVDYLSRHGWRRGAAAALCVLLTLALLLWAAASLVLKGVGTVTEFMQSVPGLMSLIEQKLLELENRAMDYIGSAPEGTAAYLETAASSIGDMLYSLPATISGISMWSLRIAMSPTAPLAQSPSVRSSSTPRCPPWPMPSTTPPTNAFMSCPSPASRSQWRWKSE